MIFLFRSDKRYYLELSEKTGFHKDIIEKVHRLILILEFINSNAFLRERLVLYVQVSVVFALECGNTSSIT